MRFSYKNMPHKDKWLCPCGRCLDQSLYPSNLVKLHLLKHGIDVTYSEWTRHGETSDIHVENHNNHGHMDETFEEEQLLEDLNLGRCNFDNYDPENTDVCYDDFNDTPDLIPDDEMDKFQKKIGSDDTMVHSADSVAWKDFDKQYPWFGQDPRNIRLGFATDGMNMPSRRLRSKIDKVFVGIR
ncbi:hypothetical protein ACJIZ3_000569 [Penstemon smallii]|uniref:Transposase-associated domain-containing protein n=1 Tax=Penstemon smallii TaxID=265156 RepID=A0ABD3R5Z1_9LAMI